jgi:hypothetical protein
MKREQYQFLICVFFSILSSNHHQAITGGKTQKHKLLLLDDSEVKEKRK